MKKKILITLTLIAMLASLVGCSNNKSTGIQTKDGEIMSYTEEDIPEGLYIKSNDLCYPLLWANSDQKELNYQWFTSFDNLIPELKKGDTIILYSNSEVPVSFKFWKMIDFGYSIGTRFVQDETTGALTFPSSEDQYCPYSPVGNLVLNTTFNNKVSNVSIKEVNGKEFKETMLTVDGFMKGLTKDAMYKFWYYQGTVYNSINLKADTHIFIQDYDLSTGSYVELKDKVFEINLPTGMENGYWFIEGYGMFKYSGADTDFILDPDAEEQDDLIDDLINNSGVDNNSTEESSETNMAEFSSTESESSEVPSENTENQDNPPAEGNNGGEGGDTGGDNGGGENQGGENSEGGGDQPQESSEAPAEGQESAPTSEGGDQPADNGGEG